MLTIIDGEGNRLTSLDRSSRTFAKAVERGDIVATGTPLVFKLVREVPLRPLSPAEKRRRYLARAS